MYDNILVPTDGSDEVETAIEHACTLAVKYDATIHALYIMDDSSGGAGLMGVDDGRARRGLRQTGQDAVATVENRAQDAAIDVVTDVQAGLPHEGILGYADEHDIDLFVMSSRGRSGVNRFLFGSVTERVLRLTDRPVLVVPRRGQNANRR